MAKFKPEKFPEGSLRPRLPPPAGAVTNIAHNPKKSFLYELDDGHLGVVTLPVGCADDSGVAAGARAVPLGSSLEQGVHELLVVHVSQRLVAFFGPAEKSGFVLVVGCGVRTFDGSREGENTARKQYEAKIGGAACTSLSLRPLRRKASLLHTAWGVATPGEGASITHGW